MQGTVLSIVDWLKTTTTTIYHSTKKEEEGKEQQEKRNINFLYLVFPPLSSHSELAKY